MRLVAVVREAPAEGIARGAWAVYPGALEKRLQPNWPRCKAHSVTIWLHDFASTRMLTRLRKSSKRLCECHRAAEKLLEGPDWQAEPPAPPQHINHLESGGTAPQWCAFSTPPPFPVYPNRCTFRRSTLPHSQDSTIPELPSGLFAPPSHRSLRAGAVRLPHTSSLPRDWRQADSPRGISASHPGTFAG
jgi:hypothetical protein